MAARQPLELFQVPVRVRTPQWVCPARLGTFVRVAALHRRGSSRGGRFVTEWAESLRRLGMCHTGGARLILRKYVAIWGISTEHFDPRAAQRAALRQEPVPLPEVLVEHSTYARHAIKRRLFAEGLKERACELCGLGDVWQGRPMGLILDHVNGVRTDNRLENLRIVCPNCNATLDTHCGRRLKLGDAKRECDRCGTSFEARDGRQRYCSRDCGRRHDRTGRANPGARRVARPSYAPAPLRGRDARLVGHRPQVRCLR